MSNFGPSPALASAGDDVASPPDVPLPSSLPPPSLPSSPLPGPASPIDPMPVIVTPPLSRPSSAPHAATQASTHKRLVRPASIVEGPPIRRVPRAQAGLH